MNKKILALLLVLVMLGITIVTFNILGAVDNDAFAATFEGDIDE